MQDNVREQLAAVQHDIWAHWTRYQYGACQRNEDGSFTQELDLRQIKAGEGLPIRSMHDLILFEPSWDADAAPPVRFLYDRFAAGPKAIRREMPLD